MAFIDPGDIGLPPTQPIDITAIVEAALTASAEQREPAHTAAGDVVVTEN